MTLQKPTIMSIDKFRLIMTRHTVSTVDYQKAELRQLIWDLTIDRKILNKHLLKHPGSKHSRLRNRLRRKLTNINKELELNRTLLKLSQ